MNILYFTQIFYPKLFGGGEYIFFQWATELAKRGHHVYVITQRLQDTPSYEKVNGIHVFRVGSILNLKGTLPVGVLSNLSFLVSSFLKGIEIARKNKIDVIHSNTYIPVISAQACSGIMRIPHVATVHDVYYTSRKDFWDMWSSQSGVSSSIKFLGPLVEKIVTKMPVTLFHTVSQKSKSDLEAMGVSKNILVIPNGINYADYDAKNNAICLQAIFVGRLVFYKNIDVIIDAFGLVVKKIPDAKLIIVGEGPTKYDLIKKVDLLGLSKSISFTGNISHQDKVKLISESQVLLNPSLVEGFGIVVLEGFACGKPVIVSDSKPLSDLVDDSIDGYVVPAHNPDVWAEKIADLISNPKKSQEMGETGKKKAISKYSISKVTDDLLDLYKQVT